MLVTSVRFTVLGKNPNVAEVVKSNTAEGAGLFPELFIAICALSDVAAKPNKPTANRKEVVVFMISDYFFWLLDNKSNKIT
jgi:hypothetical protein